MLGRGCHQHVINPLESLDNRGKYPHEGNRDYDTHTHTLGVLTSAGSRAYQLAGLCASRSQVVAMAFINMVMEMVMVVLVGWVTAGAQMCIADTVLSAGAGAYSCACSAARYI